MGIGPHLARPLRYILSPDWDNYWSEEGDQNAEWIVAMKQADGTIVPEQRQEGICH